MSDAPRSSHSGHHNDDTHEVHEGPIKTPKQLILAVVFSFLIPIIGIVLLATFVTTAVAPGAGSDGQTPEAIAKRIQPIGSVEVKDVSDPASMKNGLQVYTAQCSTCHAGGVAGAPKFGDAGAWGPRITQGFAALVNSALKGKGAMAPQGGGDFSDLEISRAVAYMANQGGAKFEEPKAAPAAASSAESAAPATTAAAPATTAAPAPAAPASAAAQVAAAPTAAAAGAVPALYTQACSVCHAAGVAGAPKLGDKAAWAPRLAQGIDALTANVVKGKGAMPPKGGSSASDAEIKSVVTYLVNAAK